MSCYNCMELARQGLALFIKSLPVGSQFVIIGFGTHALFECIEGPPSRTIKSDVICEYNDDTQTKILERIKGFKADYCENNMLNPLELLLKLDVKNRKKIVFILTDGGEEEQIKPKVIAFADKHSEDIRIHTFGIGSGCDGDKDLIVMTAKAGRGCYNFADDNSTDLSGQVISALNKASQPSLQDCSYSFFGQEVKLGEVFRDQLVQSYQIVSKAEFEKAKVNFKSAME